MKAIISLEEIFGKRSVLGLGEFKKAVSATHTDEQAFKEWMRRARERKLLELDKQKAIVRRQPF